MIMAAISNVVGMAKGMGKWQGPVKVAECSCGAIWVEFEGPREECHDCGKGTLDALEDQVWHPRVGKLEDDACLVVWDEVMEEG